MSSRDNDLRPEYPPELIKADVWGQYADRYRDKGTNLVLIDPALHEHSPVVRQWTKPSETAWSNE